MKEFDSEAEELAWFVGLVEGEGSFNVSNRANGYSQAEFSLKMTDLDVIERAQFLLLSWGIDLKIYRTKLDARWKAPKQPYVIQTKRASSLKTIIEKTYIYFSHKKRNDCERVLANLADRGLLLEPNEI